MLKDGQVGGKCIEARGCLCSGLACSGVQVGSGVSERWACCCGRHGLGLELKDASSVTAKV